MAIRLLIASFVCASAACVLAQCKGHDHGKHEPHKHVHDHGKACAAEKHARKNADCEEHNHRSDACTGHAHDEHDHRHGHDEGSAKHGHAEVKVPSAAQKLMGLELAAVEMRDVSSLQSIPGRFELPSSARSAVSSTLAGRCRIYAKQFSNIKKGDKLFSVFSAAIVSLEKEISILEKRVAVYSAAKSSNAELASQLASKRAGREAMLRGRTAENGTVVFLAEEDGIVESVDVPDGKEISSGDQIMAIVSPSKMRLKLFASPSEAAKIPEGTHAKCGGAEGHIVHGYSSDPLDVPLYVEFGNAPSSARQGARAIAEIAGHGHGHAMTAVPEEAVVMNGLVPTVFVRDAHDPETFIAMPVEKLATGGGWTAVRGIRKGDLVVTSGAYELKLALPSGETKKSGHFHADGTFHETDD